MKRRELEEIHHAHIEYSLLVTYLVLPTVAQAQFKGLNCLTLESGREYLRVDTSVDCSFESRDYKLMLGITIPFILLYQVRYPLVTLSVGDTIRWCLWVSGKLLAVL